MKYHAASTVIIVLTSIAVLRAAPNTQLFQNIEYIQPSIHIPKLKALQLGDIDTHFSGYSARAKIQKQDVGSECDFVGLDSYSIKQQIISLFVILAAGLLGVLIPIIGYRFEKLKPPKLVLELGKFLGIGVILSTALIHIYASSVEFLSNECISEHLGGYEGWSGLIFIFAVFIMQFIDFLVLVKYGKRGCAHLDNTQQIDQTYIGDSTLIIVNNNNIQYISGQPPYNPSSDDSLSSNSTAFVNHKTSISTVSVILLEISIIFHSVIIGLTLGLSDTTTLLTLTIALSFHQFFEGFAVGDRLGGAYSSHIEKLDYDSEPTPVGQTIGIITHTVINTKSATYLILLGVLEAIAAGILVYVALIHLISIEFSSQRFLDQSKTTKTLCFLAMYTGAAIMAVIGQWA
ncbi:hypothetical protein BB561_003996 [Smittium simulii]|uniref:Zinc/iron permease n=1 Tax=Smittium simulii TaxID=133385 RepID=A0A2T9YIH2_9FUNG|nr:hypothetical protein BB561_003996 [Smittium simulii]